MLFLLVAFDWVAFKQLMLDQVFAQCPQLFAKFFILPFLACFCFFENMASRADQLIADVLESVLFIVTPIREVRK